MKKKIYAALAFALYATTFHAQQVDFKLLKELAKKFGWVIQAEKKSGIEEAMEDVKAGRVFHAKDAHDLIKQCLE